MKGSKMRTLAIITLAVGATFVGSTVMASDAEAQSTMGSGGTLAKVQYLATAGHGNSGAGGALV